MKALTVWQPWASLIMIGAKPFEFRRWNYADRYPKLVGQRIVIHAGSRPIKPQEVQDIVYRLEDRISSLKPEIACPLLDRLLEAHRCQGVLPLAAGLGSAILERARRVDAIFSSPADSDRIDHHMYGWPLTGIAPFKKPIQCRGAQGFWNWPSAEQMAGAA